MKDSLAQLHIDTYNSLASEYESRVETYRAVTTKALTPFIDVLPSGAKVLDVGCAVGYTVEILNQHAMDAEGIDISSEMIEFARKRNPGVKFVVGDFLEENYLHQEFDGALLYAFLHLFPKEVASDCIKKVVAILKNEGYAFIGTTKSEVASEGFEQKADYESTPRRFRKRWTPNELESLFKEVGLKIVHYEDNTDEFGKVWMDYVVQKSY